MPFNVIVTTSLRLEYFYNQYSNVKFEPPMTSLKNFGCNLDVILAKNGFCQ